MQVGPDCTWVKSRMCTPSSALPACAEGLGRRLRQAVAVSLRRRLLRRQLHDLFRGRLRLGLFLALAFVALAFFAAIFVSPDSRLSRLNRAVMPAKAGIQLFNERRRLLSPRFRGDDSGACRLLHCVLLHFFFSALCGLRLPMRPLSLPAAGSSTALIRVGLPESIAALTARLSSSGVVALTPTPPKASIILS